MATFLALSSQVARGHVGLSAMTPALQRLGHEVIGLPTIVLSNHPGHARAEAIAISPGKLVAMVDALEANGWLAEVDAVITGYLPSAEHVDLACEVAHRIRAKRADALVVADPVLGDFPKGLYIDAHAAETIRDKLLPLADFATPNAFELGWLSGRSVNSVEEAIRGARALGVPLTLVTSVPGQPGQLVNVLVSPEQAYVCRVPREERVPHGTGDFLTAVAASELLQRAPLAAVIGRAVAATALLIVESLGRDELALVTSSGRWEGVPPLAVESFSGPAH